MLIKWKLKKKNKKNNQFFNKNENLSSTESVQINIIDKKIIDLSQKTNSTNNIKIVENKTAPFSFTIPSDNFFKIFINIKNLIVEGDVIALKKFLQTCSNEEIKEIINKKYAKHTPLLYQAALNLNCEICEVLLENGALPNITEDVDEQTPLHIGVFFEDKSICEILIEKGASIDAQNKNGNTPLHLAVIEDNPDIFRFLIEKGADIHIQNKNGKTAYDLTVLKKNKEIIDWFNRSSFHRNTKDKDKVLPLCKCENIIESTESTKNNINDIKKLNPQCTDKEIDYEIEIIRDRNENLNENLNDSNSIIVPKKDFVNDVEIICDQIDLPSIISPFDSFTPMKKLKKIITMAENEVLKKIGDYSKDDVLRAINLDSEQYLSLDSVKYKNIISSLRDIIDHENSFKIINKNDEIIFIDNLEKSELAKILRFNQTKEHRLLFEYTTENEKLMINKTISNNESFSEIFEYFITLGLQIAKRYDNTEFYLENFISAFLRKKVSLDTLASVINFDSIVRSARNSKIYLANEMGLNKICIDDFDYKNWLEIINDKTISPQLKYFISVDDSTYTKYQKSLIGKKTFGTFFINDYEDKTYEKIKKPCIFSFGLLKIYYKRFKGIDLTPVIHLCPDRKKNIQRLSYGKTDYPLFLRNETQMANGESDPFYLTLHSLHHASARSKNPQLFEYLFKIGEKIENQFLPKYSQFRTKIQHNPRELYPSLVGNLTNKDLMGFFLDTIVHSILDFDLYSSSGKISNEEILIIIKKLLKESSRRIHSENLSKKEIKISRKFVYYEIEKLLNITNRGIPSSILPSSDITFKIFIKLKDLVESKNAEALKNYIENSSKIEIKEIINTQYADHDPLLYLAASLGNYEVFEILLQNGALPYIKSKNGNLPSYIALLRGHNKILDTLFKLNANNK